jgi:uncharacterized protein
MTDAHRIAGTKQRETEVIVVGKTRVPHGYGHPKDARFILERDVYAPMRDGVHLATNVYRPEGDGPYPAIFSLCPYGKDAFPADENYEQRIPNTGLFRTSEWVSFEAPDPVYWVPHGFVVIAADCRATNASEGDHFEHFSKQMGRDFHDLVEWIADQPWCDGNVAANGVSYLGTTQWLGAAERPPHLKAIIPWEAFNDPYREHAFHGGIPDKRFFPILWKRNLARLRQGATTELIFEEQDNHPLFDDYWRDKHPDLSRIDVPAYIATSWSTGGIHLRGTIEGFKQIASRDKWLEIHGRKEWEYYYQRESLERQRRFLDQFLKGRESGIRELPRVRFEVRERFFEGRFRFAEDFPIPGTEYRKLHLDAANGVLSPEPVGKEASVRYSALASDTEPDSAEFDLTFEEGTEVVGYMKLRLWVSADGADDLDLHVGIRKLDRHGQEVHFPDFNHVEEGMVTAGWLRVSHRELDEERSTPWQPWLKHERLMKLAPGEIVPVEIEIMPSGTAFNAGETLKLIVQGRELIDFWFRQNPEGATVSRGHPLIHAGGRYDSHLLVPVIPPAAD